MALHATDGHLKRRGTNPPELVAAALAGSFSLSLANELGEAGYRPRQIDTTATVTMENLVPNSINILTYLCCAKHGLPGNVGYAATQPIFNRSAAGGAPRTGNKSHQIYVTVFSGDSRQNDPPCRRRSIQ
jgi:hypothetical protein